jgi:Lysozyme like domain
MAVWLLMIAVFIFAGAAVMWIIAQGMDIGPEPATVPTTSTVNVIPGTNLISTDDIAMYAANAGWSGPDLQVAVAVALAESSGYADVVGDLQVTPGGSIGLWQINLKAHPQYTASQLADPQTNANAAYAIYQAAGNEFTPWSAYNNSAFSAYLVQAQQAVNA